MSKMVIAVDVDDVLVESAHTIIDDYNQRWGTILDMTSFYASHDPEAWGTDVDTAISRVNEYVLSDAFTSLPPTRESVASLQTLIGQFELHVLTGRPDAISEATKAWLNKYFPGIFVSANFSNLFNKETYRSKGEMCAELGIELLIDDHLKHLISAAEHGIPGILFGEYVWNQTDKLPVGVTRCKDWPAVLEYFEDITNE